MLISQKIKIINNGETPTIKIPLVGQDELSGEEQEIQKYINTQTTLAVNQAIDGEKFIYKRRRNFEYNFQFYDYTLQTYNNSLLTQGFTTNEFSNNVSSIQNSFFIAQYFDSTDLDNQTLLHASYFNGYQFISNGVSTIYNTSLIRNTELTQVFLSQQFINSKLDNRFDIYVRYYFFNSKTGGIIPMLATNNETLNTSSRLFYSVNINKTERNFDIISQLQVNFKEVPNLNYRNKITNTVDTISREKQNPPLGQGFTNNGKYIELL